MANTYVKAAIAITMTRSEATIIRDAELACDIITDGGENIDLSAAYERLSAGFKAAFPARPNKPFASFFAIFDDPVYPTLDCEIEYGLPDAMGMCELTFRGDAFGIEAVAMLLFTACKSALPCAFEYAYDCDRSRIGEFGGGAAIITAKGVTYPSTARFIHHALAAATKEPDEDERGLVLATRDADHGLSFWNDRGTYDRLAAARVFTEADAAGFELPATTGAVEWLTMPRTTV